MDMSKWFASYNEMTAGLEQLIITMFLTGLLFAAIWELLPRWVPASKLNQISIVFAAGIWLTLAALVVLTLRGAA